MKYIYITILLLTATFSQLHSQYITRSFSFGGSVRQFLLYVPPTYDGSQSVPFVMALHGLGDNMNNFKNINLKAVADTANFIFAIPQALVDQLSGSTAWNSGAGAFGITLNANVNDVGFLNALIDTVSQEYSINQSRVYATGFSMGGFMSNRLACQLNNRIAAIASVSGTIGNSLNCQPGRAVPVAHFHGTADATVAYSGNQFGNDAEELMAYWINNNSCDTTPTIDSIPDTKADGKTIIRYRYLNGNYNTTTEFYKIVGGAHEWLTSANDINYSVEIWNFFNRFEWTVQPSGLGEENIEDDFMMFPNPASGYVRMQVSGKDSERELSITDLAGKRIKALRFANEIGEQYIDVSDVENGVYMVVVRSGSKIAAKKLVINQ